MAAPAAAINTYNSEPAPERTEVGAFVALWDTDDDGVVDRLDWVCSGAMVDDDTFLTAAHCTDDWPAGTRFFVSLEQDIQTPLDDAVAAGLTASEAADELLADGVIVEADAHQDAAYPGTGVGRPRHRRARLRDAGGHAGRRVELHAGHAADRRAAGRRIGPRRPVDLQLAGRRLRHRGGAARARWPHPPRRRDPPQGEPRASPR